MRIFDMQINNQYGAEFRIERKWTRDYLFLYIKTPAIFVLNGERNDVSENSVIIFPINELQMYYAKGSVYSDDFIHFYFDEDYSIMNDLGLPFNKIIALPDISDIPKIIGDIYREYLSVNSTREKAIDLLLKLLFTKISEYYDSPTLLRILNPHYEKLLNLRTKIFHQPERKWRVEKMAEEMNLSTSYFQTLYKETFGHTCMQDVIKSRIEHAKYLLSRTSYTVAEIAFICGYQNDTFFMRQFKNTIGITPSEYRKNH